MSQYNKDTTSNNTTRTVSDRILKADGEAISDVKDYGEALGLSSSAIETAQAVALGTIEAGRTLRRGS